MPTDPFFKDRREARVEAAALWWSRQPLAYWEDVQKIYDLTDEEMLQARKMIQEMGGWRD